ncbi:universal stress protein [Desulfosoma caldarium]|uniref:Universal stress protein n=1 Tax=Desulfosoma caldarium TaxID=610254 RepID=A0A3N1UKP5_9BACT|nr:universal stress protein [Desulfosoma caldarium]ROQ90693.1 nucleotide-binding universal stress UspA family protein [Desulfosoma caldarium]
MFKKILFPVDFSPVSEKIVPVVREMAERFQAKVHVLFVARIFDDLGSMYVPRPSIKTIQTELAEGARKKLNEFLQQHFQDLPMEGQVVSGDPAEEILKFAATQGMDLIVMGTHGRKGLERIVFGSVAERVVKGASVPVLTVNPYGEEAPSAA